MHKYVGKLRGGFAALVIGGLIACTPQFQSHGYAPSDTELAQIVVGSDTRATVSKAIGRPTSSGLLDDSGWYYVESRFRNQNYRAPKEINRELVAVSFDSRGRVSNIERFGLKDGQAVRLSRRVTKTTAARSVLLAQLLRNLGNLTAGNLLN
ncbi:MAG: outer membrane protein assembly factor BamE [Marinosulfonomonas sp.]|nr:outer membrane protein assembly factor BamE [Marinosulfonomonas sp.]